MNFYIKNLTLTRRLCGSFPEQNNKNKRKVYYLETDKYNCLYILTESRLEIRAITGVVKKIRSLK